MRVRKEKENVASLHFKIRNKVTMKKIALSALFAALLLCSCRGSNARQLTAEMACEAVNNYCHQTYDWSMAEENPDMMYVAMGSETETEYEVIFRSYTGAFVHFHVDKASGMARMVEQVPAMNLESEAGTINLFDYLGAAHD